MRKLHYLMVLGLLAHVSVLAQCPVPNASFEDWSDYKDTLGYELDLVLSENVEFPTTWFPLEKTINIIMSDFFTPYLYEDTMDVSVFHAYEKMSPGYNSEHAIMLHTDTAFSVSDAFTSFPCSERPDHLSFVVNYKGSGNEILQVFTLLGPERLDFSSANGFGQVFVQSTDISDFQTIKVPVSYNTEDTPEKAIIQIRVVIPEESPSVDPENYFIVDDVQFDPGQITTPIQSVSETNPVSLYPNPAIKQSVSMIQVEGIEYSSVKIYTLDGAYVGLQENTKGIDISQLPAGPYVARFVQNFGEQSAMFIVQE